MSIDRMKDYTGRHWALRFSPDQLSLVASVHHFSSEEVRDGWVSMDPELRVAVDVGHPVVQRWLSEDPNHVARRGPVDFFHRILKALRIID